MACCDGTIPGALAAKLVYPERKVAATGDGGFMMNCQELETALRVGTPCHLNFQWWWLWFDWMEQQNQFGKRPMFILAIRILSPADSMGLKGYRVESTADFIPTLKTAQDVPSVIDCPVDYRELPLHPKAGDLSCKLDSFGDTSQLQTAAVRSRTFSCCKFVTDFTSKRVEDWTSHD